MALRQEETSRFQEVRIARMANKITLLKAVDRIFGATLAHWLPPPRRSAACRMRSFLVIRPGGIGDAVHLIPMVRALLERYPDAHLTVLAERRNAGAFALCPVPIEVLRYDVPGEFLRALRRRFDVVIDTEQWHRLSSVVARLIRAPVKIGFATNERQRLFTEPIPYAQEDYEAEAFCRLLVPLGIEAHFSGTTPWLTVPQDARERIAALTLPRSGNYVVLFPGASIAARRWGTERFRALAVEIHKLGWQVLVIGGGEDRAAAQAICREGVGFDFSGMTSLAESAAILAGAALLVSGDSGVLHLGVGLGIPTVSLFGPGIARKWAPRGARHTVLNLHLPCSPCTRFGTTPPCPKQVACLDGIGINAVVSAVKKQLQMNGCAGCSPTR